MKKGKLLKTLLISLAVLCVLAAIITTLILNSKQRELNHVRDQLDNIPEIIAI